MHESGTVVLRENLDGSYDWDRTSDLSIMSAALQPTELRSHKAKL